MVGKPEVLAKVLINGVTVHLVLGAPRLEAANCSGYTPIMRGKLAGLALILLGVAVGILWVSGRATHPFTPVAALLIFLVGASMFGKTSRLAERMRPLVGKIVYLR